MSVFNQSEMFNATAPARKFPNDQKWQPPQSGTFMVERKTTMELNFDLSFTWNFGRNSVCVCFCSKFLCWKNTLRHFRVVFMDHVFPTYLYCISLLVHVPWNIFIDFLYADQIYITQCRIIFFFLSQHCSRQTCGTVDNLLPLETLT